MADPLSLPPPSNALSLAAATEAFGRCCAARRWVQGMLALRPFASREAVFAAARAEWAKLGPADFFEAFAQHPEIGQDIEHLQKEFAATSTWARAEQSGAVGASEATLLALREGNRAYRARFGYAFIVCATGKSAEEMRSMLEARLNNAPEQELTIAAAEQAKITYLRLEKLDP